ncbi:hypothetical protein ACLOJK_036438 [Asimina triloba]
MARAQLDVPSIPSADSRSSLVVTCMVSQPHQTLMAWGGGGGPRYLRTDKPDTLHTAGGQPQPQVVLKPPSGAHPSSTMRAPGMDGLRVLRLQGQPIPHRLQVQEMVVLGSHWT